MVQMLIKTIVYIELEQKIDEHKTRIENLENNMTIDYGQQRVLEDTVNKTVIDVLCGKDSYAYEKIGRKVFAECNRDLKHYFNVNARNNIPKKRFDEAVEYAKNWKPYKDDKIRYKHTADHKYFICSQSGKYIRTGKDNLRGNLICR